MEIFCYYANIGFYNADYYKLLRTETDRDSEKLSVFSPFEHGYSERGIPEIVGNSARIKSRPVGFDRAVREKRLALMVRRV